MAPPARSPGLLSVLARPGYRRLWSARTVSQCGDVAQFTTVALLVYEITASGVGVTGVVLAEIAPVLLLAPAAGTLVDRLPRVTVMVSADLVRMALAGVLVLWHDHLAVVYLVAAGLAAGAVFFNPAASSLLPTLVDDEEIVAANSGIWSAAVLAQVLIAPVAGLVATTAGFGAAFAVNAGSFALSAVLLRGLGAGEVARPVPPGNVWTQGREALGLLRRDRLLRAMALAQALAALSAGATSALLVVLAVRHLGADGGEYGLMLAAIGVGAFLGPILLTRMSRQVRRPRVMFAAFGVRGGVDLVIASVAAVPATLAALTVYGLATSTGNVTFSSVLQTHVPEALRGRVFSAFDLIWQSMRLVSLLAGGVLADLLGIRSVYYVGGLLLLLAAVAGLGARARPGVTD